MEKNTPTEIKQASVEAEKQQIDSDRFNTNNETDLEEGELAEDSPVYDITAVVKTDVDSSTEENENVHDKKECHTEMNELVESKVCVSDNVEMSHLVDVEEGEITDKGVSSSDSANILCDNNGYQGSETAGGKNACHREDGGEHHVKVSENCKATDKTVFSDSVACTDNVSVANEVKNNGKMSESESLAQNLQTGQSVCDNLEPVSSKGKNYHEIVQQDETRDRKSIIPEIKTESPELTDYHCNKDATIIEDQLEKEVTKTLKDDGTRETKMLLEEAVKDTHMVTFDNDRKVPLPLNSIRLKNSTDEEKASDRKEVIEQTESWHKADPEDIDNNEVHNVSSESLKSEDDGNDSAELSFVSSNDEDETEPTPYVQIQENDYLINKKKTRAGKEIRRMKCECSFDPEDPLFVGCGDDCLNRVLMIECGNKCSCGEFCTNKNFQRGCKHKLEVFKTNKKGWGLRTTEDINKGEFIIEYCGEVVDQDEFVTRTEIYDAEGRKHYYFMTLKAEMVIDATRRGAISRFINHSCDPNCETQKWTVNGFLRVGFFAIKHISAGEELCFDYKFERYGPIPSDEHTQLPITWSI